MSFVCVIPACTQDFGTGGGSWYYKVSSKRMRNKEVQVIPWVIGDSSFVRCSTSRMVIFFLYYFHLAKTREMNYEMFLQDASKTVFVGALHGMLSAECLANIFQDLFKGNFQTTKKEFLISSSK